MNDQEYERLKQAAADGTIPDSKNPIFIFSLTDEKLLQKIVEGRIDCRVMASRELENRGYVIVGARKLYKSYDAKGNPIRVTIPEDERLLLEDDNGIGSTF